MQSGCSSDTYTCYLPNYSVMIFLLVLLRFSYWSLWYFVLLQNTAAKNIGDGIVENFGGTEGENKVCVCQWIFTKVLKEP